MLLPKNLGGGSKFLEGGDEDCYAKGGECCNGYCCNEEYFSALAEMPCFNDLGCSVRSFDRKP